MKVCFETFGCRLNRAEALQTEADYLAQGWTTTDSHSDADLIVVRGCSVTARAQHDCERLIDHLRRKYPVKRLIVTGCLPGAQREIRPAAPDAVPTRTARAYLKVQDGCNATCTFCIVPTFRGKSVSVPFGQVLDRARRFIDAGYHELVVTGCNLMQYAADGKRLVDVLEALARICAPTCRIRLGSLEPVPAARDIVALMAENAAFCRFLHLPVQSNADLVLRAMHRPYTSADVEAILKDALERLPFLGLGCDLMTGFPGETEYDFLRTEVLLAHFPFSKVHIFPYSERPGTAATGFGGVVPREVRLERARRLSKIAEAARARFAGKFVGRDVTLVVEDAAHTAGWTGEYLWCRAASTCKASAVRKELRTLRVVKTEGDTLVGVPL